MNYLYFIYFFAAIAQAYFLERTDAAALMLLGAIQFSIYFFIIIKNKFEFKKMLVFSIFLRFTLVFALPNLSDDIYRFLWDGTLWHEGLHPLAATPTQVLAQHSTPVWAALYPLLNSPDYFTIYPSVCQAAFFVATACAKILTDDTHTYIYIGALALKLLLAFAECGTLLLLPKCLELLGLSPNKTAIYALNPLVLHEICGNAHCEGFMVFFFVAAAFVFVQYPKTLKNTLFATFLYALSICSKLLPLLFLPLFLAVNMNMNLVKRSKSEKGGKGRSFYFNFKKVFLVYFLIAIFTIILSLPLFNASFVANFGESLNLYFQKFEYNVSLYYMVRAFGFWLKGYNWIAVVGPAVAGFGIIAMLGLAFRFFIKKEKMATDFFKYALFTMTAYLLCTTVLHPWYLVLPVLLACFTDFKYPMLWSVVIFVTYINYSHAPFYESKWVLCLEYGFLFVFMVLERYKKTEILFFIKNKLFLK
jgi:alpha-1,6-mannosyltransferase